MVKVINSDTLIAERKEQKLAEKINSALIYRGDSVANLKGRGSDLAVRFNMAADPGDIEMLRRRIGRKLNAAETPSSSELEAFFGRFFIDLARRTIESPDFTPVIADEQVNMDFPDPVYLRDLYPYRGAMGRILGKGDSVPLIEAATGGMESVSLFIDGVGYADSLYDVLFNRFRTIDKIQQAAIDAYVDKRNAVTVGVIVAATFVASQKQAADTTAGATFDELTYKTIRAAKKKLRGLKNIWTGRRIIIPRIAILCNSADTDQIQRVVMGQLEANGGGARGNVAPSLGISQIVEYDRGICDGIMIGKKEQSFPGVTEGKCYLFVPGIMMVANKRGLTMETGSGSVLELSTEERAWYCVQGEYTKEFMGSSAAGASVGAGYGYVVEVTLPT